MQSEEDFLVNIEKVLINMLIEAVPNGAEELKKIYDGSCLSRIPFLAQLGSDYRPIPDEDTIPALLTEGLETIEAMGLASSTFGPNFRPSDADIRAALDEAVGSGVSKERAGKILTAWAGYA